MDGREATRAIAQQFPKVKVLVLSTFDDDRYIADSMRAGAKGYLLKERNSQNPRYSPPQPPQSQKPRSTGNLCQFSFFQTRSLGLS